MKKFNLLMLGLLILGALNAQDRAGRSESVRSLQKDEICQSGNNPIIQGDRAMWDVLWSFDANAGSQPGIETDGNHIYCPSWNSETITRYNMAGCAPMEFTIDGVTDIRDLAYDGTYFYGAAADLNLKVMDFENQQLIETITINCSGVSGVRHIAFDPNLDNGNGGFWLGNWEELGAVDRSGNELVGAIMTESCYGSAYDNSDPANPVIWLFQQIGSVESLFQQFDINTLSYTNVTHEATDVPGIDPAEAQAGGACTWDDPVTGQKLLIGNIQQGTNLIFAYELSGESSPYTNNMQLMDFKMPAEVEVNEDFNITVYVKNLASENVTYFDLSYGLEGGAPEVIAVENTDIPTGGIFAFTIEEVFSFDTEGDYTFDISISNINMGTDEDPSDNDLSKTISVIPMQDGWEVVWTFEANSNGQPGIETDGNYIYCPAWEGDTISRYDMDGGNAIDFTIDGVANIRDLAFDGTYFYGAAADMDLKVMDFENQVLIETINANCSGITGIRHIAFDPNLDNGNGGFWIGNWAELGAVDMNGNELVANVGNENCYGSAYDDTDPENPVLWLFQQNGPGEVTFHQFDINTLSYTGFTHNATDVPGIQLDDCMAGGACTWDDPESGQKLLIGNIQQSPNLIFAYQISIAYPECYNFDQYTAGNRVAESIGGLWTTWSNQPGTDEDGLISDEFSHSPDNSFVIGEGVDLVYQLNDEPLNSGAWLYSHYIYVPSGFGGYFNIQSSPVPGEDWVIELFFNDDGSGYFEGGIEENFTYQTDTWMLVEINFDLDADLAQVFFDGELVVEFASDLTIGGVNYYGNDNGVPKTFYDDVCFTEGTPIGGSDDCYNFDNLIPGEFLAQQLGGMWTTWSGNPPDGDGFVSNDQSHSPPNSFVIWENINDVVFKLDEEPIETGAWLYSHYIYVPSGSVGYFNIQSSPVPGEEWVVEMFFNADGTGYCEGGSAETFEYPTDSWVLIEINFDLDSDLAQIFIDGEMISQFENTFTIGGVNYYGNDGNGAPEAYYDDVCFTEGTPISGSDDCYNFDNLIPGEFLAQQLGGMWTTWSGNPPDGDGFVSNDQSHSPPNSFVIWENINDVVFKLDEEPIETGAWLYSHYIYVPSGSVGYFNIQSSPVPGEEWVVEMFFNADGTGYCEGGSAEIFEYPTDSWVLIEINFDLDSDLAQIFIDGEMISQFENTFTIGGVNYYGNDGNGAPEAYYDDVCFTEGTPLYVGIEDIANEEISIFPNPANDVVCISSSVEMNRIQLITTSGQLIWEQDIAERKYNLNVSGLETGIYFVKIYSDKGISTQKMIIR